jgi:hypothetical protein
MSNTRDISRAVPAATVWVSLEKTTFVACYAGLHKFELKKRERRPQTPNKQMCTLYQEAMRCVWNQACKMSWCAGISGTLPLSALPKVRNLERDFLIIVRPTFTLLASTLAQREPQRHICPRISTTSSYCIDNPSIESADPSPDASPLARSSRCLPESAPTTSWRLRSQSKPRAHCRSCAICGSSPTWRNTSACLETPSRLTGTSTSKYVQFAPSGAANAPHALLLEKALTQI